MGKKSMSCNLILLLAWRISNLKCCLLTKKCIETFSYLIVTKLSLIFNCLLPIFFSEMKDLGIIEDQPHRHPSSVYIRWHIIYGLWHDELGRSQPLKAAVPKGDVTDLKCSLAFDQDEEIVKINNLGKQDFFFNWSSSFKS